MSWVYLISAGLIEVVGVVGLKKVSEKGKSDCLLYTHWWIYCKLNPVTYVVRRNPIIRGLCGMDWDWYSRCDSHRDIVL